jgi:hypothetical protein
MMVDSILDSLAQNGVVGSVLAIMLWFNYKLTSKLFEVIKANTEVMANSTRTQEAGIEVIKKHTDAIRENKLHEQSHMEQSERTHEELHLVLKHCESQSIAIESIAKNTDLTKSIDLKIDQILQKVEGK